jgi:hypothetical protein
MSALPARKGRYISLKLSNVLRQAHHTVAVVHVAVAVQAAAVVAAGRADHNIKPYTSLIYES